LAGTCILSLAVAACSSSNSNNGDGGSGSTGTGPSTCKDYHACALLTFAQVSAVIATGGSDAGSESVVGAGGTNESLCIYQGPNASVGLNITCGSPETPAQLIGMQSGTVTAVPNLGNQAVSVVSGTSTGVLVFAGVNDIINFKVTVVLPDGGGSTADPLAAAKTLAGEIVPEL
jgi:hypothetical protein